MHPSEEKPLPAVGVYWIDEVDYPTLLKIFDDGDTMPDTDAPTPPSGGGCGDGDGCGRR